MKVSHYSLKEQFDDLSDKMKFFSKVGTLNMFIYVLKGLHSCFSCFGRFVNVFKPLLLRNWILSHKNNLAAFKCDLRSVVVINQIFCVVKDELHANGFNISISYWGNFLRNAYAAPLNIAKAKFKAAFMILLWASLIASLIYLR